MMTGVDRQTEQEACEQLLKKGRELYLAMGDDAYPYLVPLNYGYLDGRLYIHSPRAGKKLDCLGRNSRVCFAVSEVVERVGGQRPCQWSTEFRSVIGYGTARILDGFEEKIDGYDAIMSHFGGPVGGYDEKYLNATVMICIEIEKLTGKWSEGCQPGS